VGSFVKPVNLDALVYHGLWHTFATWLLTDGAPIQHVQAQLGHATIVQTRIPTRTSSRRENRPRSSDRTEGREC
jgi:site-specific recombinase XerD